MRTYIFCAMLIRRIGGREARGFTLLELLVTMIIISILAAIAIPVFFRQRDKGFVAQSQSALANAKLMAESYYVGDGDGSYADLTAPLVRANDGIDSVLEIEGLKFADQVFLTVGASDADYCIIAVHSGLPSTNLWQVSSVDSSTGSPSEADSCPV